MLEMMTTVQDSRYHTGSEQGKGGHICRDIVGEILIRGGDREVFNRVWQVQGSEERRRIQSECGQR